MEDDYVRGAGGESALDLVTTGPEDGEDREWLPVRLRGQTETLFFLHLEHGQLYAVCLRCAELLQGADDVWAEANRPGEGDADVFARKDERCAECDAGLVGQGINR